MALFNPSRDQVRQFFFETWAKFRRQQPLTELEGIGVQVMQMHPEYHAILEAPERYLDQAYFPEMGETNPFLHLSLHLAVYEQLQIDQPPGLRDAFSKLCDKHGNQHDAFHDVIDCLGETVWKSQREGLPPDSEAYVECVRMKL